MEAIYGDQLERRFGIAVFGHTRALWEDALIVLAFGAVLLVVAIISFSGQE